MRRPVLPAASKTRPTKLGTAVAAVAILTAGLVVSVVTASGAGAATRSLPVFPNSPGIFTERCKFSHQAANDPIMMPRMPGMAMHHDFFGNAGTNAFSTASSLRGKRTTCATSADSSGYWIPVAYQHGHALTPRAAFFYWRGTVRNHRSIHSVPRGLQLVAGNAMAMRPSGTNIVAWGCGRRADDDGGPRTASPHSCPHGAKVKETIIFPSCWDGHTLNAKRHPAVYPNRRTKACPRSHPVRIPQLLFHVLYPTSSGRGIRLSLTPHRTASTDSAHADFVNGWNQSVLNRAVHRCLSAQTRCGRVTGHNATPHGPTARELGRLRTHQAKHNRR